MARGSSALADKSKQRSARPLQSPQTIRKHPCKMRKYLLGAALCALATPALATTIDVVSYATPDGLAFNDVTTAYDGYSYYTGPVVFTLGDGSTLTVYCVDLNHYLQQSGTYAITDLTENGLGQTISEALSNEIGQIAMIGANALAAGGTANLEEAAAAQAAIWDLEYSTTSVSTDSVINTDLANLLGATYGNNGHYATALQPVGEGWYLNGNASQQMVLGVAAPELSTWAMMGAGFGLMGLAGWRKRRAPRLAL